MDTSFCRGFHQYDSLCIFYHCIKNEHFFNISWHLTFNQKGNDLLIGWQSLEQKFSIHWLAKREF